MKASLWVLNKNLLKMQYWTSQWKISFNLNRGKQAKFIYSRKTKKSAHPHFYFINATVKLTHAQKPLGLQLDNKLSFSEYTNNKISKTTKGIRLLPKLQAISQSRNLLIIYKSFIRPHLDYYHPMLHFQIKLSLCNVMLH